MSATKLPVTWTVVSSAKRTVVESNGHTDGKSFIWMAKRVGPRTDPCRTPAKVGRGAELMPFMVVHWERSDR